MEWAALPGACRADACSTSCDCDHRCCTQPLNNANEVNTKTILLIVVLLLEYILNLLKLEKVKLFQSNLTRYANAMLMKNWIQNPLIDLYNETN